MAAPELVIAFSWRLLVSLGGMVGAVGDAGCFGAAEQAEGAECIFPVLGESTALLRWGQERSRDSSCPQRGTLGTRDPSGEGCSSGNKAFLSSSDLLPWSELSRDVQTATRLADTHVGPMLGSSSFPWDGSLGLPWSGDLQAHGSSLFCYP